ncbi:TPA: type IV conjugative transfer system protein TraE [Legionella anisa]
MDYKVKEGKLSRLSARLSLMVVLVIGLMMSNIILVCLTYYSLGHQKREVVPFGNTSGYIISETSVDENYLNLMTQNFIYTRLNITPRNVERNHGTLLSYIDSSIYSQFKKKLKKEMDVIKDKKMASHFYIIDVQSDSSHLISRVKGQLQRYVGYRALKLSEKTYQIQYRYQLGKLTIVGFAEDKGEHHA